MDTSTTLAHKAQRQLLDVCYGLDYNTAAALSTIWAVNPSYRVELIGKELDPSLQHSAIAHHRKTAGCPIPLRVGRKAARRFWAKGIGHRSVFPMPNAPCPMPRIPAFFKAGRFNSSTLGTAISPQFSPSWRALGEVQTERLKAKLFIGDALTKMRQIHQSDFLADAIFLHARFHHPVALNCGRLSFWDWWLAASNPVANLLLIYPPFHYKNKSICTPKLPFLTAIPVCATMHQRFCTAVQLSNKPLLLSLHPIGKNAGYLHLSHSW